MNTKDYANLANNISLSVRLKELFVFAATQHLAEKLYGEKYRSALRAIDSAQYRLALAVVRPELIPTARQRWPHGEIITVWSAAQAPGLAAAWLTAAA